MKGTGRGSVTSAPLALALLVAAVRLAGCRDYGSEATQGGAGNAEQGGAGNPAQGGAGNAEQGGAGNPAHGGSPTDSSAGASLGGEAGAAGEKGDAKPPLSVGGAGGGGAAGQGELTDELRTPADFEGLVLWLRASSCLADGESRVGNCPDASGKGNDANQLDAALRPLLVPDALNARAVLHFDGGDAEPTKFAASSLRVEDSSSLQLGIDDFSIVIVARWNNDAAASYTIEGNVAVVHYGGYGGIFQKVQTASPYRGISLFANYPLGNVGVPSLRRFVAQLEFATSLTLSYSANLNDNVYRVYGARRYDHDKLEVTINGNPEGLSQVTKDIDASASFQPIFLGGATGQPFRGDIAEVVMLRGAVAFEQLRGLELGLMAKYDL